MATSYRYDPALDAQARAVWRGLVDSREAAATAESRALQDYGVGTASLRASYDQQLAQLGWGEADAKRSYDRTLQDIATGRTRTTEDYGTSVAALGRAFDQLRNRQAQQARAQGVLTGGALLAAAQKRAANRAIEQQQLDTGYRRTMEDFGTNESRAGEDFRTATERFAAQRGWLQSGLNDQLGALGLSLTRSQADTQSQLTRAEREWQQFGIDTAEQRRYLMQMAGF